MKKIVLITGYLAMFATCEANNYTTAYNQNTTDETSSATPSGNIDEPLDRMPPEIKITSAVGVTILSSVAIVGNVLTIYSFITDAQLRRIYDLYILNLAAVDLCIACISIPAYVVYSLNGNWIFGPVLCKIWLAADFTFCLETVFMVMIISLDRLLYIKLGIQYSTKVTPRVAKLSIFASWVLSFLVYAPAILWWDQWVGYSTVSATECHVEFAYDFHFTFGTAFIEFFLPALGLTIINGIIYREIRGLIIRRQRIVPEITASGSICATAAPSGSHVTHWSHNSRKMNTKPFRYRHSYSFHSARETPEVNDKRLRLFSLPEHIKARHIGDSWCRKDRGIAFKTRVQTRNFLKAARSLALLVAVFIICWAPYTILTVALSFCRYACINAVLYEFLYWWLWVKSAVNPFLYAYSNSKYRSNFHNCLTCQCFK